MKNAKGLYYFPFPKNKSVRVYVKKDDGIIFFRIWNNRDPQMWEEHGWVPYGAIKAASGMYTKKQNGFDPRAAYDIDAARALLKNKRP